MQSTKTEINLGTKITFLSSSFLR